MPLPIGLRASKSRHPVPTRASRLTKAGSQAVCGGGAPRQGFEPRSRDPESRVFPTRRPGNSTSARTRTWGLPLRKRALSPLSYRGRARHTYAARNQRAVELSIHMPSPDRKGQSMGGRSRTCFSPVLETGRLSIGSPTGKAAWDVVLRRPLIRRYALPGGLREDSTQLIAHALRKMPSRGIHVRSPPCLISCVHSMDHPAGSNVFNGRT